MFPPKKKKVPAQAPEALIDLRLHKKQGLALLSDANEIGYGGAAGGGKSHLGRASAIYFCGLIPNLSVYLFRRQHNELVKNHMEGPTSFPALLAPWVTSGKVRIVKDEIRFWNGSKIFLCHCQHEKDVYNWMGPEMHYLIIEQAEQFTPFMIAMLRGRNRIPLALDIPNEYKHLFPRVLYTFNPGGPSHHYFKTQFVNARADQEIAQVSDEEGGHRRQFIRALLTDNPSVNPTEYKKTLSGLPPKIAKAYIEGNFDIVVGAYFPEIDRRLHLLEPFQIEDHWLRFMAYDHGACGDGDPFVCGWFAVVGEDIHARPYDSPHSELIPRGSLICYRIWNGQGMPKTIVHTIAEGILIRERKETITYRVAGGDIGKETGTGPSVRELFHSQGINFSRADQDRIAGAAQVRERLVGASQRPLSYWFKELEDDLETIGNLQHDPNNPNDCAQGNDHVYEMHRYACMSRPWPKDAPKKEQKIEEIFKPPSIDQMWAERTKELRLGRR